MAARKQFTFEQQARLSVILAAVGAVSWAGTVGLLLRNFTPQTFWVTYNPKSLYLPVLGLTLLVSLAASAAGFFIGLHSAGQRRNTRSGLSWLGFFLSAGLLTLSLCAALFFYFARNPVGK